MRRLIMLCAALAALASCEEAPLGPAAVERPEPSFGDQGLPPATNFDPAEFAWSKAPGAETLSGVLAYRRQGVQYGCGGEDVLLIPDTPWSRRRMVILYGSANTAAVPVSIVRARTTSAAPGDYARYVRSTKCDAQGRFAFQGLPDGSWYVVTIGRPVGQPGEAIALTRRVDMHGASRAVTLF